MPTGLIPMVSLRSTLRPSVKVFHSSSGSTSESLVKAAVILLFKPVVAWIQRDVSSTALSIMMISHEFSDLQCVTNAVVLP